MSRTHIASRRRAALAVLVVTGALLSTAQAQEAQPDFYKDPGIYPNRDYVNQHVTENVDPFNGALQIQSTDVFLPGNGGFDLKVIRSFNSTRINPANPADLAMSSLAGIGWTVHFGRTLRKGNQNACSNGNAASVADNPVLELPDGSRQVFAYAPFGSAALMITAQRWRAECIGIGTGIAVYSPDGVRYDMAHQVVEVGGAAPLNAWYTTQITDRNGNTATINYAGALSPQINSITTSDGRSITFTYYDSGTANRRIQTIVTGGRTWAYGYQPVAGVPGRHYLISVTRPDTALTSWTYAYYTAIVADNARNYQMQRLTYPQGGTLTYDYGFKNFDQTSNPATRSVVVTSKTSSAPIGAWSFTYTPSAIPTVNDTTVVTTPTGPITYKHVGASTVAIGSVWRIGLLVEKTTGSPAMQTETFAWGSQVISDENNIRVGAFQSKFDSEMNAPILTARTIVRDGATYRTTYSNHDSYGNPQSVTEAGPNGGNRTTNLTYYVDTTKWIVQQVDGETTVNVGSVLRGWDANGNLVSESRDGVSTGFTRHPSGDIWTITRPRGLVSTFINYFRGIPRNEAHPEGVNVLRVVSDAGNVTSEKNGEGQTTLYGYDGLNRLALIDPPLGESTIISYTATSQTATRGLLQQVTTLDGFARAINVATGGFSIAASYDSLGRKIFGSIIGFPTVGHTFQYDVLNRVSRITHNADNSYRQFTYSALAGVPTVAVRNERNVTTTHTYRAYGDPDKTLMMSISAPPGSTAANVTLTRDHRGFVRTAVQNGKTRTFNYDSRYYLTSTVHPEVGTTIHGRDDAGNMTSKQVGSSGATTYQYDGRNRLWRVTYPNGSPSPVTNTYWRTDRLKTVTNAVATRSYGYDQNQNLTSESLAIDGLTFAATYSYNSRDQLSSIVYPVFGRTVSFSPNALGLPTLVTGSLGWMVNAVFWPNGQIYDIAFAGGSRVTYGQNAREWLESVTVKTGDNVTRIASALSYDVAGNLVGVVDSVDASYNRTFAYDGINRLTTANGPWGTGVVDYDGSGNITRCQLGSIRRDYVYDPQANRLNGKGTTNLATGSQVANGYSYDAYGNANFQQTGYAYDNANNLTSVGQTFTHFHYDGANGRVRINDTGRTTYEFRTAYGQLLVEWTKENGVYDRLKEHLYLAGREVAEQRTEFVDANVLPSTLMFLQHDANGSPISSTWAGGGQLFKENYQPYGSQINGTANWYTQRAFTGHKQERPDLIYMGGRYYDPEIGRFLSIDPKEVDPSDIHSLNRYAYANNNPSRHVDPDGYSPVDLAFFAIDAAKLGIALYTGSDVKGAAIDLGLSAVGVLSPVPGAGQALKTLRVADRAVEGLRAADNAVDAAKGVASESRALTTFHPINNGAVGQSAPFTLLPGARVDRFGRDAGRYLSPEGTPMPMRALGPTDAPRPHSVFEVQRPFTVQAGTIAPAYGQPGLGLQFYTDRSVSDLLRGGFLTRVGK